VLAAVEDVRSRVREVGDANPAFMTPDLQALVLEGLAAARAQLDELELRVVASACAMATTDAARDVAAWQVAHNRRDLRAARAEQRLAEALDRRYGALRVGMAEGRVHLEQAHVIAAALDELPADLSPETSAEAERVLVALAERHTPRELKRLGERILTALDVEEAEEALARRLEAEQSAARSRTSLSFRPRGDGTTRITAVVPDPVARRLTTYLEAFTSPRRGDERGLGSYPQLLGQAFCALLERVDPDSLPRHGGRATTVVVTIGLDSLRKDLGVGELPGGGTLSAGEIRRLACTAGIAPLVLGGNSQILDLGRTQRLFRQAQVLAMTVRDKTCRAEGCETPAPWCEAHHWRHWSAGGRTDLADGVMLCSHHHHRVHDHRFTADRLPNGDVRFTRRR
jgi:hypothetical protein